MRRPTRVPSSLALLLALSGCVGHAPPLPLPGPDGGFATCAEACESLRARGCSAGEPDEEGVSCEVVCADAESLRSGLFLTAAAEPCRP